MTVQRYHSWDSEDDEDGHYVAHEDYATLLAERDALSKQVVNLAVENAALTSGCGFFAYDPDNGFEQFKTRDEAIAAAESYIDYYRGDACDGWADEVSQVSWGVIMQESTKVDERPKNEEDSVSDYIDTVCDFALLPDIAHPATDVALVKIQAQGVEKFADDCDNDVVFVEPEDTEHYELMAEHAREFADKLRKGAAV